MGEKKPLNQSSRTQTLRVSAGAIGAIPVVGPIVQAALNELIPDVRQERITKYLLEIEETVDLLVLEKIFILKKF